MSKLSNLTDEQIHQAIEAMQNGIAIKPNSEESQALQLSINRAYAELERRAQKKREAPPTLETENDVEKWEEWAAKQDFPPVPNISADEILKRGYSYERQAQTQHVDAAQTEQAFNIQENRVVVGRASDVVVNVPVVEVLVGGKLRVLTQSEILGLLKTWFKGVATSKSMLKGLYTKTYDGEMGKTVYRLFDAWNLIYKQTGEGAEWPPKADCFPGLKNAKHEHKVAADVLWRWASRGNE